MSEYQNLWILLHLSELIDVPAECKAGPELLSEKLKEKFNSTCG